jgi:hypothetical protein
MASLWNRLLTVEILQSWGFVMKENTFRMTSSGICSRREMFSPPGLAAFRAAPTAFRPRLGGDWGRGLNRMLPRMVANQL